MFLFLLGSLSVLVLTRPLLTVPSPLLCDVTTKKGRRQKKKTQKARERCGKSGESEFNLGLFPLKHFGVRPTCAPLTQHCFNRDSLFPLRGVQRQMKGVIKLDVLDHSAHTCMYNIYAATKKKRMYCIIHRILSERQGFVAR